MTKLGKYRAGNEEPLNFVQWRQIIRGSGVTRRINSNISSAYEHFVKINL